MKYVVVLFIVFVVGYVHGIVQTVKFPVDEEPNYNSTNENDSIAINFSGLELTNVTKNFLSSPIVNYLDLSHNQIISVDPEAFINLPNLTYLNISKNEFNISDVFSRGLLNLETLVLDNMRPDNDININSIYPKLKRLFIRHNILLRGIYTELKNPFPSLTHLYLTGSRFYERGNLTGKSFFQLLPNTLEYLDISRINTPEIVLRNLDNLQYLKVDEYESSVLKFEALNKLKYLSAVSNKFNELHSNDLSSVPSLIFLDLSDNFMQTIQKSLFFNSKNLQYLYLSKNCIHRIEEGSFDNLAKLKMLDLGKNQLTEIPALSNEKLTQLSLLDNELTRIVFGTFKKLSHLEVLHLDDNKISFVDQDAFVGLSNLKNLMMSNNLLTLMPSNWMVPLVSIQNLDLKGNLLHDFDKLSLSESLTLESLQLTSPVNVKRSQSLVISENVTVSIHDVVDNKGTFTGNIKKCSRE